MLYFFVRPFATIALKIFFRRIYFANAEVIPADKPVILAANHPTAFLEPCIMACLLDRPLYFLVRGDLWKKKLYGALLTSLHMIPVFRMKDGGYKGLKQNFESLNKSQEALAAGKTIMILAEGTTVHEKRLRPLRKGAARLALGAVAAKPDLDLWVVPVGVNYTYAERPRSEVMIEFGKPLRAADYLPQYQENNNIAIEGLTNDLADALEKHIIIIDDKKDEALTEQLFQLQRNDSAKPILPIQSNQAKPLHREKQLAFRFRHLAASEKTALAGQMGEYFDRLKTAGVTDFGVARADDYKLIPSLISLVFGFIPFILGTLANVLPVGLAQRITRKKVKEIEYFSSVMAGLSMVLTLVYGLVLAILLTVWMGWSGLACAFLLPFFGYFALIYKEYVLGWRESRKVKNLPPGQWESLTQERAAIMQIVRPLWQPANQVSTQEEVKTPGAGAIRPK